MLMGLFQAFPAPLVERFDIVSFDPRGTGGAERVDCGTDAAAILALDQAADPPSPASSAWAEMADACRDALGDRIGLVSTAATVRDLDLIRQALGEETIDWFGTSYGTRLGVEYLRRFPDRVRSMVLDGAMDPAAPLDQQVRDVAQAAEPVLARLLESCAHQDPCPLGADPVEAYDALAARLATEPLTSSDGHPVGVVALQAAAQTAAALPIFFGEAFIEALAAAGSGQGDGILTLAVPTDFNGQSTFDAYWAILCNDEAQPPDAGAAADLVREVAETAPRVGLGVGATFGAGCQAWDKPVDPLAPVSLDPNAPILVVGSTGDPSTAYAWSERMAAAIDGARLVTREGDGHTAFFTTFLAGCSGGAIVDFLLDPSAAELPATCPD
jgi:pimeloyl-ACP methyl ester carboxylesterase